MATVKSADLGLRSGAYGGVIKVPCPMSSVPSGDILLWTADQRYRLIRIDAVWAVVSSAGGVTGMPKKVGSGAATIASGASLLAAALAVDANALIAHTTGVIPAGATAVQRALTSTESALEFNELDSIGIDWSAAPTNLAGFVMTLHLLPLPAKRYWKSF